MLNIFISWSGITGHKIASKLRILLPTMLPGVKPFMSDVDIQKGTQWRKILNESLIETRYGMFIVTPEANDSAWMGYEFGVISTMKKTQDIGILPLLFDGQGNEVPNYLTDFQAVSFVKEQWQELFLTMATCLRTRDEESPGDALNLRANL
ncbi:MAG: toll/interleukin-1 receptor domain-containing protein [Synechococcales cyanobacterium K44_A2020_017]|nr:toll/interleukin-1 receptor domain-containing protein [Synechococcales cyanobacterium K32_A2020_035]MBF2093374.1 toll/interleukin-1 receptor domain-containing protein [Synechococcales cyanobacterium K44_A2020_017]